MESVSCYNCGTADSVDFATENGYILRKCTQCGLLYVNPRPDVAEIEQAHKLGEHKGAKKLGTTGYYDFSKISAIFERSRICSVTGVSCEGSGGSTSAADSASSCLR